MSDYAKKTVADLTEILKSRGLSHTGKKADLIARLTEHDKQSESAVEEQPISAAQPEGEPLIASKEAAKAAPQQPQEPVTTAPIDSTTAETTTDSSAAAPAASTASYALNLPTSTVDSELAKRKARAERFGTGTAVAQNGADAAAESTPQADTSSEALKALERAKRFGITSTSSDDAGAPTAISKLDEALPAEGSRGRGSKRKAAEAPDSLDDPGLKRGAAGGRGRNNGGRGGRFAHRQRGGGGGGEGRKGGPTQTSVFSNEKDKAAAEARKKKFATA